MPQVMESPSTRTRCAAARARLGVVVAHMFFGGAPGLARFADLDRWPDTEVGIHSVTGRPVA